MAVAGLGTKFEAHALIQRCVVHKKRKVEDHLPDEMKRNVGRTIFAAYQSGNAARAKRMLEAFARQLERKHPSAAASLREGLDETLTAMVLGLHEDLARSLSTTNPIEFLNGRIRRTTRNVATWDGGTMVIRWLAVSVIEAAKTFRKLRGHKGMPKLAAALRAHDAKLKPAAVDAKAKAAWPPIRRHPSSTPLGTLPDVFLAESFIGGSFQIGTSTFADAGGTATIKFGCSSRFSRQLPTPHSALMPPSS